MKVAYQQEEVGGFNMRTLAFLSLLPSLVHAESGQEGHSLALAILGLNLSWLWLVGFMVVFIGAMFLPKLLK